MNTAITLNHLLVHDIKPSIQRIAVMEYLMEHRTHPTADEIYCALHPIIPTLSKTTVYNTLKLLSEKGAILQLTIDEHNVCFDAVTEPHAHFLCTRCGKVYDIELSKKNLLTAACVPADFHTEEIQLYLRGKCTSCADKEKDKK